MSTPSPSADPRIGLARTRRMLEDTALAAVPGLLLSLSTDQGAEGRWIAQVRSTTGEHVTLRLDRELLTVEILPADAASRAA